MLKDWLIVKIVYKLLSYFEIGKGTIARFYQFIPDIIIIIGGVKYLLNVNITPTHVIIIFIGGFTLFVLLGLFLKKSGLYETDKNIQANNDPVQSEILKAARKINKGDLNGRKRTTPTRRNRI